MRWLMSVKHYFLDTDVIFNFSITLVRAEVNFTGFKHEDYKIITTRVISNETDGLFDKIKKNKIQRHTNINDNQLKLYIKTWKKLKKDIHIFNSDTTYGISKNLGEKTLIDGFNNYKGKNRFIVSNNKKDILKFGDSIIESDILTPFEFYENFLHNLGLKYKNILQFMIISNEDLRVNNLASLGNIVNNYRLKF